VNGFWRISGHLWVSPGLSMGHRVNDLWPDLSVPEQRTDQRQRGARRGEIAGEAVTQIVDAGLFDAGGARARVRLPRHRSVKSSRYLQSLRFARSKNSALSALISGGSAALCA